jgi:hypothetical protein
MNLTIRVLNNRGFVEIPNQQHKTLKREVDNVILYEWQEPIWLVQLDGVVGQYANLMRVVTEKDLEKAIEERNIR